MHMHAVNWIPNFGFIEMYMIISCHIQMYKYTDLGMSDMLPNYVVFLN